MTKREGAQAAWEAVEVCRLRREAPHEFFGYRIAETPRDGAAELTEAQAKAFDVTVHRAAKWYETEMSK